MIVTLLAVLDVERFPEVLQDAVVFWPCLIIGWDLHRWLTS